MTESREGTVEALWVKRARRGPMDAVDRMELVEGKGIRGNADQGGRRQVTLLEHEVWTRLMQDLGADADPSVRRANVLVQGVPLRESRRSLITIGGCVIRIIGETKPCERMDEAVPGLKEAMWPDWAGGAYGEVVRGGEIRRGDPVRLAPAAAPVV